MKASQAPLNAPCKMKSASPPAMKRKPKPRPMEAAIRVAQPKSPGRRQSAERSTRPPSSGSAGSRLKRSRARLM